MKIIDTDIDRHDWSTPGRTAAGPTGGLVQHPRQTEGRRR